MEKLKRYTLPIVLGALALIALAIGILSITVWKPAQEVAAERDTTQPFIATRAGLLRLYEPYQDSASVRVEATAPEGKTIWIALGDPDDVGAWLTNDSYDEVVGLESIDTLKTVAHDGSEGPQSEDQSASADEVQQSGEEGVAAENPINSDMWTALKYGNGAVSMTLSGDELDQVLLAATDGTGPAPTLKLTWDTPRPNVLAMIAFPLTGVLVVLALGALIALWRTRNKSSLRTEASTPTLVAPAKAGDEVPVEAVAGQASSVEGGAASEATLEMEPSEEVVPNELPGGAKDISVAEETLETEESPAPDEVSAAKEFSPTWDTLESGELAPHDEGPTEGDISVAEETLETEEVLSPDEVAAAEESSPTRQTSAVEDVTRPKTEDAVEGSMPSPESSYEDEDAEAALIEGDSIAAETAEPGPDAEERPIEQSEPGVEETVSTDSGMINLSSLSAGLSFPTRRALREAEMRGVDTLVVGERRFSTKTGQIPKISLDDALEQKKRERSGHTLSWAQLMDRASRNSSSTPEDPENKGE
ncbi:hypothetical protein U6G28_00285 [Actinomycetaceae bacterium MB13-C1-2]|nr:hypothetical protein U6G28_00285 [Actinomycetaceae bacterium MB13-C1-2]